MAARTFLSRGHIMQLNIGLTTPKTRTYHYVFKVPWNRNRSHLRSHSRKRLKQPEATALYHGSYISPSNSSTAKAVENPKSYLTLHRQTPVLNQYPGRKLIDDIADSSLHRWTDFLSSLVLWPVILPSSRRSSYSLKSESCLRQLQRAPSHRV